MLALVNTANGSVPIELREIPEPNAAHDKALVEVHAFSPNCFAETSFLFSNELCKGRTDRRKDAKDARRTSGKKGVPKSQFFLRLGSSAVQCFKTRHFAQNSQSKKLAEPLVKYKALDSREGFGVRRMPALSWHLLQPKPSHKCYPKRRNAAHSKRFASLVAAWPR